MNDKYIRATLVLRREVPNLSHDAACRVLDALLEPQGDAFGRTLELEMRPSTGIVTLRAYGHEKPWIADIAGADPKYRYQRNFIGSRGVYKGSNCSVITVALSTLTTPLLLEIQANDRGFYVMHRNPANLVELAPIDELMLSDLLLAKEFAKALIDLEQKAQMQAQQKLTQAQLFAKALIDLEQKAQMQAQQKLTQAQLIAKALIDLEQKAQMQAQQKKLAKQAKAKAALETLIDEQVFIPENMPAAWKPFAKEIPAMQNRAARRRKIKVLEAPKTRKIDFDK